MVCKTDIWIHFTYNGQKNSLGFEIGFMPESLDDCMIAGSKNSVDTMKHTWVQDVGYWRCRQAISDLWPCFHRFKLKQRCRRKMNGGVTKTSKMFLVFCPVLSTK